MVISFEVVHAVPGRTRIRLPRIKDDNAFADNVADHLLHKPGVTSVRINQACASMVVCYDTSQLRTFVPEHQLRGLTLRQVDGRISVDAGRNGNGQKPGRMQATIRALANLILPTAGLALSLCRRLLPVGPVYALVAVAAAPIFRRAAMTIVHERRFGVDFLDATAVAIMGVQRNLPTCAFMAWLIGIGEHIREETARRSQKAIAELIEFHSGVATVMRGRKRVCVPVESLVAGDIVAVNAGDIIPIDGTVLRGRAGIDQRSLTGESAVLERSPGDCVFAGSIAVDGELVIEASAVGLDTRAGKIVQILRSAPVQETKIEDYAARFADRLVLPTFAASGLTFACSRSIARALSMLIVDFGTGVRVAAPTAFLSFMAYAAQKNIVVKGGRAMEKLAAVDTVIFDKTGTLTTGTPEVRDIISTNSRFTQTDVIMLAAAAEEGLNHPVAAALAAKASEMGVYLPEKLEARLHVGMGIKAWIDDMEVLIGSDKLMRRECVDLIEAQEFAPIWEAGAKSPLYVAVNETLIGLITYADKVRPDSKAVVAGLRTLGVKKIIVLTGDREEVARAACAELGIGQYVANVFPEQKLEIVRGLQQSGHTVAVVGDGVNDSLALANADVAIAPSGATDAAKEAADILLMEDDLNLLVEAFGIAGAALGLVKQNYKIVAVPNAAALALAAGGFLGPPGATLINNGSTIAAGLNGLKPLLMNRKSKRAYCHKTVCSAIDLG